MSDFITPAHPFLLSIAAWLDLHVSDHGPSHAPVVVVTGSGGKTSLIEALSCWYASRGLRVFVSTSTRMLHPSQHRYPADLIVLDPPERVHSHDWDSIGKPGSVVLYGVDMNEKIGYAGEELLAEAAKSFDIVFLEGDGSRSLPLKIHAPRDPVVPSCTDLILAVMGLSALGCTLDESVMYLSERYKQLTGDDRSIVEPAVFRNLCGHAEGVFKGVGNIPALLVLNQTDACSRIALEAVCSALEKNPGFSVHSCIAGSLATGTVYKDFMVHV